MNLRNVFFALFLCGLAALGISGMVSGGGAWAAKGDIGIEPPAPIYEVNPGTRDGYIWSDGCWQWDGARHRWHPGYWVAERPGHTWVPDHWEKRGDLWHFTKGHWEADEQAADSDQQNDQPANVAEPAAPDTTQDTATNAKTKKSMRRKPPAHTTNYNDPKIWPSFQRN